MVQNHDTRTARLLLEGLALDKRKALRGEIEELHRELVNCAQTTESRAMTDDELVATAEIVNATLGSLMMSALSIARKGAALKMANVAIRQINSI